MARLHISLANKCQLLFGAAVLLIICAALAVLWVRMASLVNDAQQERCRKLGEAYLEGRTGPGFKEASPVGSGDLSIRWIAKAALLDTAERDAFVTYALGRFHDPAAPRDVLRL